MSITLRSKHFLGYRGQWERRSTVVRKSRQAVGQCGGQWLSALRTSRPGHCCLSTLGQSLVREHFCFLDCPREISRWLSYTYRWGSRISCRLAGYSRTWRELCLWKVNVLLPTSQCMVRHHYAGNKVRVRRVLAGDLENFEKIASVMLALQGRQYRPWHRLLAYLRPKVSRYYPGATAGPREP